MIGQPSLPPLFFSEKKAQSLSAGESAAQVQLPLELVQRCCVQFADWGDLAKLACVQKGWSRIMMEAAEQSQQSKWDLAQALLSGSCGLQENHSMAFQLLLELANVETQQDNKNLPVEECTDDNNDNNNDSTRKECFAPAMKKIARCFLEGNGVEANKEAGVAWLRASYNLGKDVDAAHELALVYEYGEYGVAIDPFAAAQWLHKAAEEGHVEAMAELGLCYELGCGVEQSDEHALDWYMKAANSGHVTSKFSVAECFEEARGVPQSDEEACLWYYKAALEGDHDSKIALKRLEEIARIVVPGVKNILEDV